MFLSVCRWFQRSAAGRGGLLLVTLGVALLACTAAPPAQPGPPAKTLRVGYLAPGVPPPSQFMEAFLRALGELGQTATVEFRYAGGDNERFPQLAAELVDLAVDVIVAPSTPAISAARGATETIPIVMVSPGDPVATGLVTNVARPGGNITGLTTLAPGLSGKRLEGLLEVVPGASRVSVIGNLRNAAKAREWEEAQGVAPALGLELQALQIQAPNDFEPAVNAAMHWEADALLVMGDPTTVIYRERIIALANSSGLPAIYDSSEFPEDGGLMSYGPDRAGYYRRAAYYVDRILRGARPGDLPIEQPSTFELVVNLRTANAIGVGIPQRVLLRADRLIQ